MSATLRVLLGLTLLTGKASGQIILSEEEASAPVIPQEDEAEHQRRESEAQAREEAQRQAWLEAERLELERQKDDVGIGGSITMMGIGAGGAMTGGFFGLVFLDEGSGELARLAFIAGGFGLITLAAGTALLAVQLEKQDAIQREIDALKRAEFAGLWVRPDVLVAPGFVGAGLTGHF